MAPKTRRSNNNAHVAATQQKPPGWVTVDMLPDEVLLNIFDHYVNLPRKHDGVEAWCTLVHVCLKWQNIVLESPLRLNLRIHCHPGAPVGEKLNIWPTLPIVLAAQYREFWKQEWGVDNVAAALEQNNRICEIVFSGVPTLEMEDILGAMHKSFPVLTELSLRPFDDNHDIAPVDPDLFLGGSIPCLRTLFLVHVPFPELPKLLVSAIHLTDLVLNLSPSGYISPEAMVSCFFALTRLETLSLEFEFPESFPIREHRPPPPPTRTLLPALTNLYFYGANEYLEDLVARIDTPLLDVLKISFSHQFISDTAQLAQFINRVPKLNLKAHNVLHVNIQDREVHLKPGRRLNKGLRISYQVEDSQVLSAAHICTSSLFQAFSATVECLYIYNSHASLYRQVVVLGESNHWMELLRPFTSVKNLYLSVAIVPRIAPALREIIREGVAGVLPTLNTLFLEKSNRVQVFESAIFEQQFSGRPIAVSFWEIK